MGVVDYFIVSSSPKMPWERGGEPSKILILGDSEVGKTSILLQFCDNTFSCNIKSTIGVDFRIRNLEVEGQQVRLQIWDTAGQERFRSIGRAYYRGSEGIIVVFDLTNRISFEHVEDWVKSIKLSIEEEIPIIVLANKMDLREARCVEQSLVEAFCKRYELLYYEVSAKSGENIEDAFKVFASVLLKKKLAKIELKEDKANQEMNISVHKSDSPDSQRSPNCCKK